MERLWGIEGAKKTMQSFKVFFICINILSAMVSFASTDISDIHTVPSNIHTKIAKIEFILDNKQVTDSEQRSQLEALIRISIGSPFSRHGIQQSVISLYATQKYAQIDVFTVGTTHGERLNGIHTVDLGECLNGIHTVDLGECLNGIHTVDLGKTLIFQIQTVMKINQVHITGVASAELNRSIQNVLRLKPGDMYFYGVAATDLESIMRVCGNYGYFAARVEVKTDTTRGNLTYQIALGHHAVVTEFHIQGNSAIFAEHIKKICRPHVGKIYMKATIHEDFIAIRSLYRKRHYPNIKIHADFDHTSGVLTYHIQQGKQLLLDFVDTKGKPLLQDSFIQQLLANLQRTEEESERNQLRRKIERYMNTPTRWIEIVQAHYQQKGYYGTEVHANTLTNAPLHVEFTIKPGNRYTVKSVEIIGNTAFTKEALLREIETKPRNVPAQLMRRQYFSELSFEKDKNRLAILYEKSGYPNVKITSTIERYTPKNGKNGEVAIKLNIVEPYKEVLYRCSFQGNKVLSDNMLHSVLSTPLPQPNAKLIQKNYENAILKAYQDNGYIDAKVEETLYLHKNDKPTFRIDGDFTDSLNAGTLPNAIKNAFKKHNLSIIGMSIARKIDEEWSIQDVEGNARYSLLQEQNCLALYEHGILQFTISEGDKIEFGQFKFDGDLGVYPNVLHREVAHLTGTLFTPDKLNRARQNIYNTRIFEPGITYRRSIPKNDSPNVRPSPNPNPTVVNDVSFRLQKRKPGAYGASVGISSADGPRGTISLSHLNLFRRNIRFQLRGRWGFRAYLYETTITEPWFIGRTSGSFHLLGRKLEEDDGVRALQSGFRLSRKLPAAHRLNLEYSYRFLKDTSLEPTDPEVSTTVSSVQFLWRQDTQFPSLNPVSGMLNSVTVEYAGGIFGGRSSFIKTIAKSVYHQQLHTPGYVLSTSVRLGLTTGLQGDSESELISFERFWAGGSTTVRGYAERGLGPADTTGKHRGNVLFVFNTELRFTVLDPIQGILFLDSGNVWGSLAEIDYTWMPTSIGVGLRLNLGPLIGGVDYAVPLRSVPNVPTNSLYLRIGSTF